MDLSDDDARQQAAELIARADEIMCAPGGSSDIAARLEQKWAEITGGEERSEREIAARTRAAELIAKANEALAQPRHDHLDADERERAWKEHEEARRALKEPEAWLEGVERREDGKGKQQPEASPQPQRRRSSAALTRADIDNLLDAIVGAMAKSINIERALWREELGKLEIRLNAIEQGIRDGE